MSLGNTQNCDITAVNDKRCPFYNERDEFVVKKITA